MYGFISFSESLKHQIKAFKILLILGYYYFYFFPVSGIEVYMCETFSPLEAVTVPGKNVRTYMKCAAEKNTSIHIPMDSCRDTTGSSCWPSNDVQCFEYWDRFPPPLYNTVLIKLPAKHFSLMKNLLACFYDVEIVISSAVYLTRAVLSNRLCKTTLPERICRVAVRETNICCYYITLSVQSI